SKHDPRDLDSNLSSKRRIEGCGESIMAGKSNFHANLPVPDGKNWDTWVKQ
ncbi:hypothetical protein A2U01_0111280, partial [Trifolium medium]|nr:hypothetical protein [Trifolium medium]